MVCGTQSRSKLDLTRLRAGACWTACPGFITRIKRPLCGHSLHHTLGRCRSADRYGRGRDDWQNGYTERFIRTIKEEEVDLSEYEDDTDAVRQLERFLDEVYMHKRIHSSLGYLTPIEFERQWLTQQADQPAMD
jgi:transposase InsO family protein